MASLDAEDLNGLGARRAMFFEETKKNEVDVEGLLNARLRCGRSCRSPKGKSAMCGAEDPDVLGRQYERHTQVCRRIANGIHHQITQSRIHSNAEDLASLVSQI